MVKKKKLKDEFKEFRNNDKSAYKTIKTTLKSVLLTHPIIIDPNVQPFLTYTVDPDGFLFGNTPCGIDNYLHYQTF